MAITVEATYENGTLRLSQTLPFQEHEKVRVTIEPVTQRLGAAEGIIPCSDPQLIEWAAMDAELDFPPPPEER